MMTSSNGNIFRVTGPLFGEFTGGALKFSLISAWINGLVNNRETGDLRCHRAHYDVTVMLLEISWRPCLCDADPPYNHHHSLYCRFVLMNTSIQWRHNERDDVSVCSGAHQSKYQRFASLAFVRGIRRWPVDFPHKRPVTQKKFPFDDVIMMICISTTLRKIIRGARQVTLQWKIPFDITR